MYSSERFYIFEENCGFHLQSNGNLHFSFLYLPSLYILFFSYLFIFFTYFFPFFLYILSSFQISFPIFSYFLLCISIFSTLFLITLVSDSCYAIFFLSFYTLLFPTLNYFSCSRPLLFFFPLLSLY